jgi:uroporphyrinogen decarboxylase
LKSLERLEAVLEFEESDHVPVFLLGITIGARVGGMTIREYCTEGKNLARGQIAFKEKFGVDCLCTIPDVWYLLEGAWGGRIRFFETSMDTPLMIEPAIKESEDWRRIDVMNPKKDARMPVIADATKIMAERMGDEVGIPAMADSPLTMATRIRGVEDCMLDMMLNPDLLHKGLETILQTEIEHMRDVTEQGANTLIALPTRCSAKIFTLKQYEEFGRPYREVWEVSNERNIWKG